MADNNTLNFDLDAPAVPTLTLDPTPEAAEEKKPEPAPAVQQPEVQLTPEEQACLLYTSPSPRDGLLSRMPSSA